MTAERFFTSSKIFGESSPRLVAEDDGDSTLRAAFNLRVDRIREKLRRFEGNKETLGNGEFDGEDLKERSGEVEEQLGLKTAIGRSLTNWNRFNDF